MSVRFRLERAAELLEGRANLRQASERRPTIDEEGVALDVRGLPPPHISALDERTYERGGGRLGLEQPVSRLAIDYERAIAARDDTSRGSPGHHVGERRPACRQSLDQRDVVGLVDVPW